MTEIAISQISVSGWNPRKNFDPDALNELKISIQEHGILEPLIVRPHNNEENLTHVDHGYSHLATYELVAGERRFRAAHEIGLDSVPVVIKKLSDRQVHEIMLIENLQRSQLDPLEEASSLEVLLQDGSTQDLLGKKLGKSQAWIANRLRLLQAPEELKEMLISRKITPKHIISILPFVEYPVYTGDILPDLKQYLEGNSSISVTALESLIKNAITGYNCENVLCLDNLSYEYRDYKPFLDLSGCGNCRDVRTYKKWEEDVRYCLNRHCWTDKINLAKQACEKGRVEIVKELATKNTVDCSGLDWNQYNYLGRYNAFDETECKGCQSCKVDAEDSVSQVCIDAACFDKKQKAHVREQNKKKKEEEQQVVDELEKWITENLKESERASHVIQNEGWDEFFCLPQEDLRGILRLLVRKLWTDPVKKALKPWGSVKKTEEFVNLIGEIDGKDLNLVLYRLVFMQQLMSYSDVNQEKLEKALCMYRGDPLPDEEEEDEGDDF